jgi:virulence-associated protein VapD
MKTSTKVLLAIFIVIAVLILLAFLSLFLGLTKYADNDYTTGFGGEVVMRPEVGVGGFDIAIEEVDMKRGISQSMPTAVPPFDGYLADYEFIDTEQRIIKNGDITAKVESAEETAGKITDLAGRYEGFVQSSNIYESSTGAKSGTVIIRVPVDGFEAAFAEIKTFATVVVSESISGQDVTEQYVDIQSRLKNKEAEEAQYLDILNQATTVEDILMVTERLSWVRQEIEQLQGRLYYIENMTDMSTISTYISEEDRIEIPVGKWRPIETLRLSFRAMVAGLQGIANLGIWIIMFAALIALPIGIIVFLIIWIIKKIRNRK